MHADWIGPKPPPALARALAARGLKLRSRPAGGPLVVATRGAEPPHPPAGAARWLWLAGGAPDRGAAADSIRRGAYDVISALEPDAAARLAARLDELAAAEPEPPPAPRLIAGSPAMQEVLRHVRRVARTRMPVLVVGATGTGKEEIARLLHDWSARTGPWLPINCAAIPNELMESELFGHVKGAFSGAVATVEGRLMAAQGGTVFLDEVDDTPLPTQVKLLRVLEDGEVTRVGDTRARKGDFRIVAATNRDLRELAAQGRFGLDLYERLAIVRIDLPALRDRREDIGPLARHLIARYYAETGAEPAVRAISPRALEALLDHDWPGNIRELRNVLYHALVNKQRGDELLLSDLGHLLEARPAAREAAIVSQAALRAAIRRRAFNLRREIDELERAALRVALEVGHGSPTRAARLLGEVGRGRARDPGGTVRAMMRRLGLA